ncbi:S41 family peptidase [Metabacillus fastidiosus]|uniref:S41 family peptidase n=1 Tax=Metabacillus fastidiosus TaxID=1458 RepID=UPI002E229DEA|nr:S41 family peptidase [Metabacillus fastidiosus]MED4453956.1 S41 family peptidase [Metabacillus fastidiosus]
MKRIFLLIFVLLFCINLFPSFVEAQQESYIGESASQLGIMSDDPKLIEEIRNLLEEHYYMPVPEEVQKASTISEMIKLLQVNDPYTYYLTPQEYEQMKMRDDQRAVGIGVRFLVKPEGAFLSEIMDGSPAQQAGLKPGDIITQANGVNLNDMTEEQMRTNLSGEEGTSIHISILRNQSVFSKTIILKEFVYMNVKGEMIGKIAYIKIDRFRLRTFEDFMSVSTKLLKNNPNSFIVDLRGNLGGDIYSAMGVAASFLKEGDKITELQYRNQEPEQFFQPGDVPGFPPPISAPVILLVDSKTASASEIVTSALRDNNRVTIIGDKTYGKGVAQLVVELSNGGALNVTDSRIIPPSNESYDKKGILPDINMQTVAPPSNGDQTDRWRNVAELLFAHLENQTTDVGDIQLTLNQKEFIISPETARTSGFWRAYKDIFDAVSPSTVIKMKTLDGWRKVTLEDTEEMWPLYFPTYRHINKIIDAPLNKKFTVKFSQELNEQTISKDNIELIEKDTGERMPIQFNLLNQKYVEVVPELQLKPETSYWLVVHPDGIQARNKNKLKQGVIAEAVTVSQH